MTNKPMIEIANKARSKAEKLTIALIIVIGLALILSPLLYLEGKKNGVMEAGNIVSGTPISTKRIPIKEIWGIGVCRGIRSSTAYMLDQSIEADELSKKLWPQDSLWILSILGK